jgi:hypothetical protein
LASRRSSAGAPVREAVRQGSPVTHDVIDADYLVVGAGATGMAFVDTLLDVSDATVVMIDSRTRPGGHWNDAYPFVRLHQPSAWYGAASRPLVERERDPSGFDRGATGAEVLAYFEGLMDERLLPSGRVRWLPGCEYRGGDGAGHRVVSTVDGREHAVRVRRKRVDATRMRTEVPATHRPRYGVEAGVECVPPNRLPQLGRRHGHYTVVGCGKTGMDTVVWLLEHDVLPSRIRWIRPRDPWLLDRDRLRPGAEHFVHTMGRMIGELDVIAESATPEDLLARLEASGALLRIDPTVEPGAYRCAVVSLAELTQLRRVADVVRLGRVTRIEPGRVWLERGAVGAPADTLYVDCSAAGLREARDLPVFDGEVVNLLLVSLCRPLFSAAVIAVVESSDGDAAAKNALCAPVGIPERPGDWLRMWATTLGNAGRWAQHPQVGAWLRTTRLGVPAVLLDGASPTEADLALLQRYPVAARAAMANLPRLLAAQAPAG